MRIIRDTEKFRLAQLDFEKHFGCSEGTKVYLSEYAHENVIVVENHVKRAYYSFCIELLKVINLTGKD
jgi:hypothetical protein